MCDDLGLCLLTIFAISLCVFCVRSNSHTCYITIKAKRTKLSKEANEHTHTALAWLIVNYLAIVFNNNIFPA